MTPLNWGSWLLHCRHNCCLHMVNSLLVRQWVYLVLVWELTDQMEAGACSQESIDIPCSSSSTASIRVGGVFINSPIYFCLVPGLIQDRGLPLILRHLMSTTHQSKIVTPLYTQHTLRSNKVDDNNNNNPSGCFLSSSGPLFLLFGPRLALAFALIIPFVSYWGSQFLFPIIQARDLTQEPPIVLLIGLIGHLLIGQGIDELCLLTKGIIHVNRSPKQV